MEQPWTVMSLPDHPIESLSLPIVLQAWQRQLERYFEERKNDRKAEPPLLTIRLNY